MKKKAEKLLDERIEKDLEELEMLERGSEAYVELSNELTSLYKLKLESDKRNKLSLETVLKLGIDATAVILPILFYGIWMKRGLEFEKTGAITSSTFRGLVSKFKTTR